MNYNIVKKNILFLLIFGLLANYRNLNSQEISLPEIKNQINSLGDLKWKNWTILQKAEGDLNKDRKDDLVFILKHKSEEENYSSTPRVLVIYFKEGINSYKLVESNSRYILKKDEGGVMGDPFQSISINRNSILISTSGGSRERWGYVHRFNFRNNGFYLIGSTETLYDSLNGDSTIRDTNLLTGKTEITIEKENSKTIKKVENNPIKPLVALKDSNDI